MADFKFAIQVEKNRTVVRGQTKSTAQYNETAEWIHTKRNITRPKTMREKKSTAKIDIGISTHRTHTTPADLKPRAAHTATPELNHSRKAVLQQT